MDRLHITLIKMLIIGTRLLRRQRRTLMRFQLHGVVINQAVGNVQEFCSNTEPLTFNGRHMANNHCLFFLNSGYNYYYIQVICLCLTSIIADNKLFFFSFSQLNSSMKICEQHSGLWRILGYKNNLWYCTNYSHYLFTSLCTSSFRLDMYLNPVVMTTFLWHFWESFLCLYWIIISRYANILR